MDLNGINGIQLNLRVLKDIDIKIAHAKFPVICYHSSVYISREYLSMTSVNWLTIIYWFL